MALTLTSRETIRDKTYELVNTNIVSTVTTALKPISVAFPYQPDTEELDGKSPYMFISSGGAKRDARALNLQVRGEINLLVGTGIRVNRDEDSTVTENDIEDRLDLIEKKFFELLYSNTNHALSGFWQWIETEEQSFVGYERKGNDIYRVEAWNLTYLVKD